MGQKIGNNSQAIQAQGNVHIGLSYGEVKEIVYELFEKNFPQLVEEASDKAKENIDEYFKNLESNLKQKITEVNTDKFRDPNTQYLLNNSIIIAGRKGVNIDLNMLSEALIAGLRNNNSEMLNIVAEQALDAIPKITSNQIQVLTIVQYILYMKISGLYDFAQTEPNNQIINIITKDVDESISSSIPYLASLGLIIYNQFRGVNPYDAIRQQYNELFEGKNTDEVERIVKEKSPSMESMAEKYKSFNLRVMELTPVGKMIALINLRRVFDNLDYNIWIK